MAILSRLALLSLAAAALAGMTGIYGRSARVSLPSPESQEERLHRPSAPQFSKFSEVVGEGMILALFALAGRILFRLRLSRVPRTDGQPILLNLMKGQADKQRPRTRMDL